MGLGDIVRDVERRETTLTVLNPDPDDPIVDELAAFFVDRAVEVCADATPSGRPSGVAVLERDEELLSLVAVDTLREVVEEQTGATGMLRVEDGSYRHFVDHVEEETFTSSDPRQMLATSHEIEDRAFRVGAGRLHAGFQAPSNLLDQRERYEDIADSGVDVTIYVTPNEPVPSVSGARLHVLDDPDVRNFWVVAFDGDDEDQQCAVVAEERAPRAFHGFWTYDPDVVGAVVATMIGLEDRISP